MAHQKKLWDAAQDGDNDKLELAIGCGANINMPDEERVSPAQKPACQKLDSLECQFGATALHMAASNGHAKAVKLLADNEANIQELDEVTTMPNTLTTHLTSAAGWLPSNPPGRQGGPRRCVVRANRSQGGSRDPSHGAIFCGQALVLTSPCCSEEYAPCIWRRGMAI